jgi:hypothetical protein
MTTYTDEMRPRLGLQPGRRVPDAPRRESERGVGPYEWIESPGE